MVGLTFRAKVFCPPGVGLRLRAAVIFCLPWFGVAEEGLNLRAEFGVGVVTVFPDLRPKGL